MPDPSPVPLSTSADLISSPSGTFPIIGIGASAGGLAALETFFAAFEGQPPPGMAFVLIQHLSPDHKSLLAEILRRRTKLEIFDIEDGMTLRINCIYILPPAQDLRLERGCLHLSEPGQARGQRLPIDFFFQSLAEDQREKAIAVILSGNGGDGSEGLRAIKAAGGLVLVQTPANAEYQGMPESALATGLVDEQLEAAGMPAKLLEYVKRPPQRPQQQEPQEPASNLSSSLSDICILLKRQTGHDFSLYKPNTLLRRIERRMGAQGIDQGAAYLQHMRLHPDEITALFQDLLIGVTHFFRDAEAFQVLATEVMPQLLSHRDATAPLRIWSAGCSTGEEAYSLAILVREQLDAMSCELPVQIFATDIDPHAIDFARAGIYPDSIAAELSPKRLGRFFHPEPGGGFRIDKSIRDCIIFSEQNLIKDPPFSRIDLISCRNLLIYFNAELQKKLMPLFHYALKPDGLLFLGSAEGIGDFTRLFASLNQNAKIFRRLHEGLATSYSPNTVSPNTVSPSPPPQLTRPADSRAAVTRLPWREIAEQEMLRHSPPVAALIRRHGELLYLHGRSGLFLEPMPGEAGPGNLVKMAREGLRPALSTALHQAASSSQVIRRRDIALGDGGAAKVDLLVAPVASPSEGQLFLVQLAESQPSAESPLPPEAAAVLDIAALRRELLAKDDHLLSVRSELENANEELMASNEELQSTNEELETSKEELQSLNEELSTVNGELQSKIQSLSQSNNDMNNLLAGTGIATVFVDHHLRILRFTPCAAEIINLIASDIGRPVDHLVSNLVGYDRLAEDVRAVLISLIPSEVEVRSRRGLSYALRIRPYRTLGNVIEGAVITFVDITALQQAQACRLGAERDRRLANIARDAADAIVVRDLQGRILAWNPGATRLYGWSETEALEMNEAQRVPPELRQIELERLASLCHTETLDPLQSRRLNKSGEALEVSLVATALYDDSGRIYAISSTERVRLPAASKTESPDAKL